MPPRKKKAELANGEVAPRKQRKTKTQQPVTSKQRLSTIIKRVRDKLREDAGISTDAERLPQLTWMLFLKFLDDHEKAQEEELGHRYVSVIESPYRWRDWAVPADIQTARKGDDLIVFVNAELFEYLRKRSGGGQNDLREIVGKVFRGTYNLVRSGYILREVVETLSGLNFNSSDDVHVVSHFYETMLKEMRDASGKSGEFYTPRPLIRLIIDRLAPKLGDRILDPACGTCGFLAEAYELLKPEAKTTAARRKLQQDLIGVEKKTMPYLLGVVNLLLHGVDQPSLDERNSLASPIRQIKDSDRVEVIATNPPFGGEEEEGILNNFPDGLKTRETAVLFFQHVLAKLKRGEGRCGIVLPDGFLFGEGVAIEVKKDLLKRFNLHTVIRLPEGVFQPYTKIKTNVLFFSAPESAASECVTQDIWFYEHPLPEGRSGYSKTKPLEYAEFSPLLEWWDNREENARAWKVTIQEVIDSDFNLDIKNPNAEEIPASFPPEELVAEISTKSIKTSSLVSSVLQELHQLDGVTSEWVSIGSFATLVKRPALIEPGTMVKSVGVKWWGKGACVAEIKSAEQLQADRFLVRANDLIYNDMWARHGSVAVVPVELDGLFASAHFPTWELNQDVIDPSYLAWCFRAPWFWAACEEKSRGSTGRNAIRKDPFRSIKIPLPKTKEEQRRIVCVLDQMQQTMQEITSMHARLAKEIDALLPSVLAKAFKGGL